jgi:hypothetical protein
MNSKVGATSKSIRRAPYLVEEDLFAAVVHAHRGEQTCALTNRVRTGSVIRARMRRRTETLMNAGQRVKEQARTVVADEALEAVLGVVAVDPVDHETCERTNGERSINGDQAVIEETA